MQASDEELSALVADLESHRVERTVSFEKGDKFRQAICAFANDLPGSKQPGYLFVGVTDHGTWGGRAVTDQLLLSLTGIRGDGEILPTPRMNVAKRHLLGGEVAVVEVFPSDMPPVRFKGRAWVRVGPRKDTASEAEERVLAERRAAAMSRTWDARPSAEATLEELALDIFLTTYRGSAIDSTVVAENHRSIELQLAALRFFDLQVQRPTNAGVVVFAKNPLFHVPGAYVQYVRYDGPSQADRVLREQRVAGDLLTVLRELEVLEKSIANDRPIEDGGHDRIVSDYPARALHELFINSVIHRNYDSTTPVRISHFSDRIEVLSPGGLYGDLTPEAFSHGTAYRNPVVAEAGRVLGFVNRFGRGIDLAQSLLRKNGSSDAVFEPTATFFLVTIPRRP